jgi:hypothetical protein
VIRLYSEKVSPNEFTSFNQTLEELMGRVEGQSGGTIGDVTGLDGFCDAWTRASTSKDFQTAQVDVLVSDYFSPAYVLAKSVGLELSGT